VAPITAELASVVRNDPRIGCELGHHYILQAFEINDESTDAHIYGLFNIAFGVGSALGPIYGSQASKVISCMFMLKLTFIDL